MRYAHNRLRLSPLLRRTRTCVTAIAAIALLLFTPVSSVFADDSFTAPTADQPSTPADITSFTEGTPWYDPLASTCSGNGVTDTTTLTGNDNIEKAFNFLVGKLITAGDKSAGVDAAGIVGNLMQESNVNPNSQDTHGAHGIAQWEQGRWQALSDFSSSDPAHRPWNDLSLQLDFLWHELNTNESGALQALLKAPDNQKTPEDAAVNFEEHFERASDPRMENRKKYARQVYNTYGGTVPATNNAQVANPGDCSGADGGFTNVDGYAFPIAPRTKRDYTNLPCPSAGAVPGYNARGWTGTYTDRYGRSTQIRTCHHDNTPAFDLMYNGVGDQPIYAISDGKITHANFHYCNPSSCDANGQYCNSIQFYSSLDKHYYWYGHVLISPGINSGSEMKAGQQMGTVAPPSYGTKCWGGGPHEHIDRGCSDASNQPQTAGNGECRDPAFLQLMQKIWEALPST